jgi:hypothetical protein
LDSQAVVVVFHRPLFSKSDNLPKNKKDIDTQAVESLRAVLEREAPDVARRLGFGKHPRGGELDPDSFAVQAPIVVEIPLSPTAVTALQSKQLLVECELDGKATPEAAVHVQHAAAHVPMRSAPTSNCCSARASWPKDSRHRANDSRAFPIASSMDPNRGLAAGFTSSKGFSRRSAARQQGADRGGMQKLDRLWKDSTSSPTAETLLRGFVWFER